MNILGWSKNRKKDVIREKFVRDYQPIAEKCAHPNAYYQNFVAPIGSCDFCPDCYSYFGKADGFYKPDKEDCHWMFPEEQVSKGYL